jgi:hypothetical protein
MRWPTLSQHSSAPLPAPEHLSIHIIRRQILTAFDRHDVARFGLVIEVQRDPTSLKLF